jgi:hypothetical protein
LFLGEVLVSGVGGLVDPGRVGVSFGRAV